MTVECKSETYIVIFQNILHLLKCKLEDVYVTVWLLNFNDQLITWLKCSHSSILCNFSWTMSWSRLWYTRFCSFQDPVVYWADVRTVDWPGSWSDEVRCFTGQQLHSFHAPYVQPERCRVSRGHFLSSDIFCHRYLKINNFAVNEYCLTIFCGYFRDIFKIQGT